MRMRSYAVGGAIVALATLAAVPASAANLVADCNSGQTVQSRVNAAATGDAIIVIGTCAEDVLAYKNNIYIVSTTGASITGTGANHTLKISANNVVVKGLTISSPAASGKNAIVVQRSGSAVIDSCTIIGDNHGVVVTQSSSGRIANNTGGITGTNGNGVAVVSGSQADILNNLIQNSGNHGVSLSRIGIGEVSGNTITGNGGNGINVSRGSHLELDDGGNPSTANTIQNNGGFGVQCTGNSTIGTDEFVQVFGGNGSGPTSVSGSCTVSDTTNPDDPNF